MAFICTIASEIIIWHPKKCQIVRKTAAPCSNRCSKFDLYYDGQVNSLRVKSSVFSKWVSKHLWGHHLFCWGWYKY